MYDILYITFSLAYAELLSASTTLEDWLSWHADYTPTTERCKTLQHLSFADSNRKVAITIAL